MSAKSIFILLDLMNTGQDLASGYRSVRSALLGIVVERSETLTPKEQAEILILVDHFSTPAPVRPMDVFNLNYGSGASIVGLVLTYIIVLLQFKMGDRN